MADEEDEKSVSAKYRLRYDKETGDPVLVIVNQVKLFCHQQVAEQTEDGDIVDLKMRPTTPFFQQFNKKVLALLEECIHSARMENRTELMPQDIPEAEEA